MALLVGFSDPSLIYTYELDYQDKFGFQHFDKDYKSEIDAKIFLVAYFQSLNQVTKFAGGLDED